jgi:hypothetical protein
MGDEWKRVVCSFVVDVGSPKHSGRGYQAATHYGGARERLSGAACQMNIVVDPAPPVADFPRLHSLATVHQLTAYDVAYLDLAKRLELPLATRDSDLIRAAHAEGVYLL